MSDDGREREVTDAAMNEEPRDAGRREAPPAQVKCFVGGISWHLDDVKLKEGEGGARSRAMPSHALWLAWCCQDAQT
jgi:hypothetical protein